MSKNETTSPSRPMEWANAVRLAEHAIADGQVRERPTVRVRALATAFQFDPTGRYVLMDAHTGFGPNLGRVDLRDGVFHEIGSAIAPADGTLPHTW